MRIVDTYIQRDLYTDQMTVGCVYNDDFGSHMVEVALTADGALPYEQVRDVPIVIIERLAAMVGV